MLSRLQLPLLLSRKPLPRLCQLNFFSQNLKVQRGNVWLESNLMWGASPSTAIFRVWASISHHEALETVPKDTAPVLSDSGKDVFTDPDCGRCFPVGETSNLDFFFLFMSLLGITQGPVLELGVVTHAISPSIGQALVTEMSFYPVRDGRAHLTVVTCEKVMQTSGDQMGTLFP